MSIVTACLFILFHFHFFFFHLLFARRRNGDKLTTWKINFVSEHGPFHVVGLFCEIWNRFPCVTSYSLRLHLSYIRILVSTSSRFLRTLRTENTSGDIKIISKYEIRPRGWKEVAARTKTLRQDRSKASKVEQYWRRSEGGDFCEIENKKFYCCRDT